MRRRGGRRFAPACAALCALLFLAGTCRAGDLPAEPPAGPGAAAGEELPSLGDYVRGIPGDLKDGAATLVSPGFLPWVLAGAAATGAAFSADDGVRTWFRKHDRLGGTSGAGNVLGLGATHAAVAVGLLATGRIAGSRRESDAGMALAEALALNELVTVSLKELTRRGRPGGGSRDSFPSGHTSGTAALSASLAAVYGWRPAVAVPLGVLTAFVGASRLQDDAHWFSDVAGGMAVGGLIGAAVGTSWRERRAHSWAVLPWAAPGGGGILLARRF